MTNLLDDLAVQLSAGVARRDIIKSVASTVFAAGAGALGSSTFAHAASEPIQPTGGKTSTISIEIQTTLSGAGVSRIKLRDRRPVKITMPNQQPATVVPLVRRNGQEVELSIYDAQMNLAERLLLTGHAPVATHAAFLPNVTFSIVANSFALVDRPDKDSPDCCVDCCFGVYICANAVCCNSANPDCGNCCDAGFCPACS